MVKTMNSFLYSCILGKIHGQFYDRLVRVRLHFCTGWPYSWCIGFYVTSANTIIVKHHSTTLLLLALTLVNIKCFIVLTLLFGYLMHVTSTVDGERNEDGTGADGHYPSLCGRHGRGEIHHTL